MITYLLNIYTLRVMNLCILVVVTEFSSSGPRKRGSTEGVSTRRGEVVAITTTILLCFIIMGILAATSPPVGHPSSPEEGNSVTYPISDVKMHKLSQRVV